MYNVIILAEQALTTNDARQVTDLHEALEDARRYYVLLPCENAAVRVETALGSLAASEVLAAPPVLANDVDVQEAQQEIDQHAENDLEASMAALHAAGHEADGEFSCEDPIEELDRICHERHADEVIVMTRPHVVRELLHLDWACKARRRLDVPVLHLLEHELTKDEEPSPH